MRGFSFWSPMSVTSTASRISPPPKKDESRFDDWMVKLWNLIKSFFYEEGTWTPIDGTVAGLTLTVTSANYTKIGRVVTAQCHVSYPTTADTHVATIGGLPYTSGTSTFVGTVISGAGAGNGPVSCQVSGTTLIIWGTSGGTSVQVTNANLSGKVVLATVSYQV